ncbi:uncharacterized protein [Anabrus simplex]|uniref:uncharacterized protein isoform X2 n=1 Tax=Anabrus simplex TaxID=316456 RepID=UPI0035A34B64
MLLFHQPVDREKKEGAVENTWAFLLWKNAQHMNSSLSTLTLYQQWRRLPEERKEAWIIAGQSIQRFKILSHAKIQGVQNNEALPLSKVKAQLNKVVGAGKENTKVESKSVVQQLLKRVVQTLPVNKSEGQKKKTGLNNLPNKDVRTPVTQTGSQVNSHPGTFSETEEPSLLMSPRREERLLREEFEEENSVGKVDDKPEESNGVKPDKELDIGVRDSGEEQQKTEITYDESPEIKTEVLSDIDNKSMSDKEDTENRPPLLKSAPSQNTNMLSRRVINKDTNAGDSSEDEYVVEKILAKRYNPRKKHFEYLLKWEGYPHDQNTWEPVQNMATCVELVKTFEQNLAKQRAAQEQQKRLAQAVASSQKQPVKLERFSTPLKVEPSTPSPTDVSSSGRPVRNSKKKALGRMKTWCGSIGREDDENGGKRKAESSSDSEDGMPTKKIKLEPEDDYDDYGMDDSGNESSEEDKGIVWRQRNTNLSQNRQTKAGNIIVKSKDQFSSGIKKIPGPPLKKIPTADSSNVNGMSTEDEEKHEESNDLAVQLGLESPTKPRSPLKSSQPPVLVANSKGVVKVDPCQLPNLTSGVYIVANKSPVEIPVKAKGVDIKQIPARKSEPGSQPSAGQTGIVRKLQSSGSATTGEQGAAESLKLPKSGLVLNPAAISAMGGTLPKKPLLNAALQNSRPKLASPRLLGPRPGVLGPRPRLLGPRPELGQRPKLLGARTEQSSLATANLKNTDPNNKTSPPGQSALTPRSALTTPGTRPRLPLLRPTLPSGVFRPSVGALGAKRAPIGIPGVQTKITSAVKPRHPAQKVLSPLTAQTKSGVKPIQAMLGGAVSPMTPLAELAAAKRAARMASLQAQRDGPGLQKKGLKPEIGRGRGRGRGVHLSNSFQEAELRHKESKLVDTDGVHMEFHQESSESDSDDNLPDLPMGDLPPLEPPSPPRPFTLCPITGKILCKAEGERTPPPSPEPTEQEEVAPEDGNTEEILPDRRDTSPLRGSEDRETLLKVEMSPGGTTSKVVRENNAENGGTFGVAEGSERLTVTKIADDAKNAAEIVRSVQVMKGPGGISVPATKLSLSSNEVNTELVTMGDGVVYQISKEDREALEGQHCVYVTTEQIENGDGQNTGILTLNTAVAEAVAQMGGVPERLMTERSGCSQFYVRESESSDDLVMATVVDATDAEGNPESELVTHMVRQGELIPGTRVILQSEDGTSVVYSEEVDADKEGAVVTHMVDGEVSQVADQSDPENIVHTDAQIVGGGDINPETGKRRVLLLLPNGQLMVTDVEEEIEDEGEQTGEKTSFNQLLFPSKEFS